MVTTPPLNADDMNKAALREVQTELLREFRERLREETGAEITLLEKTAERILRDLTRQFQKELTESLAKALGGGSSGNAGSAGQISTFFTSLFQNGLFGDSGPATPPFSPSKSQQAGNSVAQLSQARRNS